MLRIRTIISIKRSSTIPSTQKLLKKIVYLLILSFRNPVLLYFLLVCFDGMKFLALRSSVSAVICLFVVCILAPVNSHSSSGKVNKAWGSYKLRNTCLSSRGGATTVQPKNDDIEPTPLAQSLYLPELLNVVIKRTNKVRFIGLIFTSVARVIVLSHCIPKGNNSTGRFDCYCIF